jgi:predicted metal-dependent HD superfamily phosphohydrolase
LRVQLFAASTRPALDEFEAAVRIHAEHLAEPEYRKLRVLILRRWKLLA